MTAQNMTDQNMTDQYLDPILVSGFLDRIEEASAPQDPDPSSLPALVDRLAALPAPPGAVVVIALPNGIRALRFFFAVSLAGHTPVLLSPSTPVSRVREVARELGACALVRAAIRAEGVTGVTRAGGAELGVFTEWPYRHHGPGHVILMSSGTSGMATGCLHTLDALLRNARRHGRSLGQRAEDTTLVSLPVYYSFALVAQVLGGLVHGSRLVLAGPPFSVADYLGTVAGRGVTLSSLTPSLVKAVVTAGGDLPAPLRTLTVGGQALDPSYVSRLLKLNPELGLYVTYGLTEAGPRVSTLAAHREPPHRHGSVGLPLDGVEVLTRPTDTGARELLVRSDTVYRRRVGEAAPSKRGDLIEPGLLATGDMGHVDDDGYVYIHGRSSDFAVVRGEKVSTATVRRAAESLPGVVRARIGITTGDDDSAVLELDVYVDDAVPPSEAEVRRRLRSLLTRNELPMTVRIQPLRAGEHHK
ncbi:class I adenylate-forming enzyme family protein [Streptomyces sp. ID05-47C]|uniref:class I adenylate-forming enzyme family protein n=1 Tax=Streptomyces sp. ID05-47C TaxID=3028665 RepID=UPI0029A2BB3F|nr:class I adenylate-forming enzyme family protein [Streptomyces sp. ID05-47C]MDX3573819.1 class I adenylate-forming enzyme family protein [Streptomyces sp. ID05-47C]